MNPLVSHINLYRSMWLLVSFDLPVQTKKQQKKATEFRTRLLKDGFEMFQFSVYLRFCPSRENMLVHVNRIKAIIPPEGKVAIFQITDKQFGMTKIYFGEKEKETFAPCKQVSLF